MLAIRDNENFTWLDKEIYSAEQSPAGLHSAEQKLEDWEKLTLEKIKKIIFNSGLTEYLTNRQIKDLKDYCLGIEVGLGTHGKKNVSGKIMEKAAESLLIKHGITYQKQVSVSFPVNGKKLFDFQINLNGKQYYLETSFFNVAGRKVQEVIRSYNGVLEKAQKNEINFLWVLDGKGLKSCKELLKTTYLENKNFMFTLAGFERWLGKFQVLKN
ncbi:MAG: hypothetical protein I3273_06605 [Candidatus Moeniiplasma glomeromycotorum]|nr:hypothetical protein [Candidatus Moeniiplasma glomeromycotorum]MCE8168222.1 hypothetical protein [Candidatus Moeniiplasma glomeromycotorum]MCE8169755.1 hypothetical protein [Candidatus Moeniiplasma glomeromycotorum]